MVGWLAVALSTRGQIAQPVEGGSCPISDDVICSMTVGVSHPGSLAEVAAAVIRYLAVTGVPASLLMMAALALIVTGALAVVGARRQPIGSEAGRSSALVREEMLRPKDAWAYP